MKIIEAKKRVTHQRLLAAAIICGATPFLLCAGLKSIYYMAAGGLSTPSVAVQFLQRLIYFIYERIHFISWIWDLAPVANPKRLNSAGNFGLLFIISLGFIGRIVWDSAAHLSSRISNSIKRAEERGWEQTLLRKEGIVSEAKPDYLQINIELDQKDQWYQRPLGLSLIGVAIVVLGQWANLEFGLVT